MSNPSKTEQIKEKIEAGVETVKNKVAETTEEIKESATKASEKLEQAFDRTVDEVKESAAKAKSHIDEKKAEIEAKAPKLNPQID